MSRPFFVVYFPESKEFLAPLDKNGFQAAEPSQASQFQSIDRAVNYGNDSRFNPFSISFRVLKMIQTSQHSYQAECVFTN